VVQVFGNSPDETAYCRLILNKETVAEALTAIQPTLMAHSLHSPVSPVLLDVSSIEVGLLCRQELEWVVGHLGGGCTQCLWGKLQAIDMKATPVCQTSCEGGFPRALLVAAVGGWEGEVLGGGGG